MTAIKAIPFVILAGVAGLWAGAAGAVPTFSDVSLEVGLTAKTSLSTPSTTEFQMAGGATVGDFDRDGWQDIFFPRLDNTPILYRNVPHPTIAGQRTFQNVTPAAMNINKSFNGAVFGDLNNDGHLDLYTTVISNNRYYMFMNNGAGGFTEESAIRGAAQALGTTRYGTSPAVGDFNKDGFLDIALAEWGGTSTIAYNGVRLLKNRGSAQPAHFDDVTTSALQLAKTYTVQHSFAPTFTDLNRDGWPDLAVAGDFSKSMLFWNNQNGTLSEATISSGIDSQQSGNPMGSTVGDYDRDGDLDWFITGISDNRLYRNNNNSTVTDVSVAAGVRNSGWGWGASFFDYDNDGWLDLAATSGFTGFSGGSGSYLYRNNGNGAFTLVSPGNGFSHNKQGRALLTFDYDNDGDLDVFITNSADAPTLLRNNGGNSNNWLKIRTIGTLSNRDGIGALITVQPDLNSSAKMIWEVGGGSNYLGQSEMNAFFGLGSRPIVDLITIVWPSGQSQTLTNVSANQFLSVTEVPEPAGLVLGGLAAAGLLLRRRRAR